MVKIPESSPVIFSLVLMTPVSIPASRPAQKKVAGGAICAVNNQNSGYRTTWWEAAFHRQIWENLKSERQVDPQCQQAEDQPLFMVPL